MALEDFLERERTEGRAVGGEASFTLDPKKVRERVAVFSEADTLYPLLRCLQAVIRVSQNDIFATRRGNNDWEFSFKWEECPEGKAFEQLLNLGTTAGFDHVGHRVGQHLFFGLSAALGTPHYRLTWHGPRAHFKLRRGEVKLLEPEETEYCRVLFSIEASWWKRLTGLGTQRGAGEELRRRLCYSPKPIHLEGELLLPVAPRAPERPWAAQLVQGSELAWRYLRQEGQNLLRVPYPELDHYRGDKTGCVFHLYREPEGRRLPLSVVLTGSKLGGGLSRSSLFHSAIFLSLEGGKADWLIPVSDGVVTEPVRAALGGGGIVALTADPSLSYDISGLKVIENDRFQSLLASLKKESKAVKKQLALSLASIGARADHLPKQYDQALCYVAGGPYLGMLGGRLIPKVRRLFGRERQ